MRILEISDHYKEIYKDSGVGNSKNSPNLGGRDTETTKDHKSQGRGGTENQEGIEKKPNQEETETTPEPDYTSPFDGPEVKDTIYHIESAGRDFFKYDRNTGAVNVDISIREWIQQDISESNS